MGRRGGFPSESAHAIYFTIVVLSPPPRRVKAMMMMIRMTAPTRAQSLQSDTNSDDVLVVVVVWLVLMESCAKAGNAVKMLTAAIRQSWFQRRTRSPKRFTGAVFT